MKAQANGLPCLLSDKMTEETKMTENAEFLSIGQGAEEWMQKICSLVENKRQDSQEQLTKAGFDIKRQADKLSNYYCKL